ncbi:MAG: arginine repressor [Clostridiales bacterium]|jgi:transcriptional regulator of arginine metabolism|nr:arginine repressor [Clostridiales bacterium]
MKTARQYKILEIIASKDIETQNQLIDELREYGFFSTQATVSRDIRELRLVKELGENGRSKYVVPLETTTIDFSDRLKSIFRESVTTCACAQNLIVIKTLPGLANAACAAIDSMEIKHLVGSLAGDDTVFLAMADNSAAEAFCHDIKSMI